MYQCVLTALVGSSPRVRGKRRPRGRRPHPRRLIPARAGKTLFAVCMSLVWLGSSPRVRGKRRSCRGFGAEGGLIPARAGKTAHYSTALSHSAAHPRACGENRIGLAGTRGSLGSSPRVRGKHGPVLARALRAGLIPARAGKTSAARARGAWVWAHPRACGENGVLRRHRVMHEGSSPRVRGKRSCVVLGGHGCGLIPARAGKTSARTSARPRGRAHPRACGENTCPTCVDGTGGGSSPRVRGKPHRLGAHARA